MIYQIVTAVIAKGMGGPAQEWAVRVTDYLNTTYPERKVRVSLTVGGSLNELHWIATYDSLAHFEALDARTQQDEQYLALTAEVTETGMFDSLTEKLHRVIG